MNLLFIGDVVGRSGCDFIKKNLYKIKKDYEIDVTIINGENSAPGNGITKASADELLNYGADIITTGNHAFRRKEAEDIFELENTGVLQPNNYMLVITPINRAIFLSTKLDFRVAISKYLWYNSK